ncbi:unnamed protein product, partial [Phaeothamnion confervicola]
MKDTPLRARDAAAAIVAGAAILLSLPRQSDIAVHLAWVVESTYDSDDEFVLPAPVVTDLDDDGESELITVDKASRIRVYRVQQAIDNDAPTLDAVAEVRLAPALRVFRGRRPVALAAGFLEPYRDDLAKKGSRRRRRLVLFREDWTVQCYDHNLVLLWERPLEHGTSAGAGAVESYAMEEAAVVLTSTRADSEGSGSTSGVGSGLVVVGASMSRAAITGAGSGAGTAVAGGVDALGIRLESFAEGREEEAGREAAIDAAERGDQTEGHFTMFALDGATGEVVWTRDNATVTVPRLPLLLQRPQFKWKELDDRSEDAGPVPPHGWRAYTQSVLRVLPHAWHGPADTAMQIAHFGRQHGAGRGISGIGAAPGAAAEAGEIKTGGVGREEPRRLLPGVPWSASRPHDESEHIVSPNVVVAHTRDGVEAVGLASGRIVCSVAMPEGSAAAAPSVYGDVDGDGVVDNVRNAAGGDASAHGSGGAAVSLWCHAVVTSGLPPRRQLFNVSLCEDGAGGGGAFHRLQERLAEKGEADPIAAEAAALGGGSRRGGSDIVFALNHGVVSSYDSRGALNWRDVDGPAWAAAAEGYVLLLPLRSDLMHTAVAAGREDSTADGRLHVLVVGGRRLAVYGRRGGARLADLQLLEPPTRRPLVGDVDGDGVNDVTVVGQRFVTIYRVTPREGSWFLAGAVAAMAALVALVALTHMR